MWIHHGVLLRLTVIFIFSESGLFYTEYTFNQIPPTRFLFSTIPAPSPKSIALHGFWIYLIPFSFFLHFFLPSFLFFMRQGFCVYVTLWNLLELQTKLALNSWDLPISASLVWKLKVCTTTAQFIIYLFLITGPHRRFPEFQKIIRGCTFMYVWLFCQSVCLRTTYMPDACGSQKR